MTQSHFYDSNAVRIVRLWRIPFQPFSYAKVKYFGDFCFQIQFVFLSNLHVLRYGIHITDDLLNLHESKGNRVCGVQLKMNNFRCFIHSICFLLIRLTNWKKSGKVMKKREISRRFNTIISMQIFSKHSKFMWKCMVFKSHLEPFGIRVEVLISINLM